jgi:hypothetical protein
VGSPLTFNPETPQTVKESLSPDQVWALIDTGATDGCIDEAFAKRLGLQIIDRREVGGIEGKNERNVYLGTLFVPSLNSLFTGGLIGVSLDQSIPIILGRDFLLGKIFIYDGNTGVTTVCV